MDANITHQSTTGKVLTYSINQEKYLRVFLNDGDVPMDNNPAEQAIRPFTIVRKDFVLIATDHGAKASTMIYSLIETAKANGLNTYKYLELLLTVIPITWMTKIGSSWMPCCPGQHWFKRNA